MTEQTKAQRLAARLTQYGYSEIQREAAAELRRMDANEAALLEALYSMVEDGFDREDCIALITRIEAERNAK